MIPRLRRNRTRPKDARTALGVFHAALVAHGLPARLANRRSCMVWRDRSGRRNTVELCPYGHNASRPDLLRLYVNCFPVYADGECWEPEGRESEITFRQGEENLLADHFAKIVAGPNPERLNPTAFTPLARILNFRFNPGGAVDYLWDLFCHLDAKHLFPGEDQPDGLPVTAIGIERCLDPTGDYGLHVVQPQVAVDPEARTPGEQ